MSVSEKDGKFAEISIATDFVSSFIFYAFRPTLGSRSAFELDIWP